MARVTVEDCVIRIPNRFELVMLAAQRARDISSGAPLTLNRDDDKNPVVALREIADATVGLEDLRNELISGMQRHVEIDEPEEESESFSMPSVGTMSAEGEAAAEDEAASEAGAKASAAEDEAEDEPEEGAEDALESDLPEDLDAEEPDEAESEKD